MQVKVYYDNWVRRWADPKKPWLYKGEIIYDAEISEEERKELHIPKLLVEIKIPLSALMENQSIAQKLNLMTTIYTGLEIFTRDWITHVNNIDIEDIPQFLSKEEYQFMKQVKVEFSPEVEALYSEWETNEETTV